MRNTFLLTYMILSFCNAQARAEEGTITCLGKSEAKWTDCRGEVMRPDGARYVGNFRGGRPDGQGIEIYPDGYKFMGEFKNGKRDGQGTATDPKGYSYVGEWKNGKRHGAGTETSADGRKYIGEFQDGKRSGQGILNLPDGSKYVGEFKDDNAEGQGTLIGPSGKRQSGQWKGGIFLVEGREVAPDGPLQQNVPVTYDASKRAFTGRDLGMGSSIVTVDKPERYERRTALNTPMFDGDDVHEPFSARLLRKQLLSLLSCIYSRAYGMADIDREFPGLSFTEIKIVAQGMASSECKRQNPIGLFN